MIIVLDQKFAIIQVFFVQQKINDVANDGLVLSDDLCFVYINVLLEILRCDVITLEKNFSQTGNRTPATAVKAPDPNH